MGCTYSIFPQIDWVRYPAAFVHPAGFRIGDIECYGNRLCEPGTHLEQITGVTVPALSHRGGLRADILNHGGICVGDSVTRPTTWASKLCDSIAAARPEACEAIVLFSPSRSRVTLFGMRLLIRLLRVVSAGRWMRVEPSNESKRLAGVLQPVRRNK